MSKAPADATPAPTPTEAPDGWTNNINMDQQQIAAGRGKFVGIGIFLFACLGLALLYPYNAIISATDWFEYAMPNSTNISGSLANANFIASLVRDEDIITSNVH